MKPNGRTILFAALLFSILSCVSAENADNTASEGQPPLTLIVTHYEEVVRPDGVTLTTRYQERIIRAEGRVWTERVLDPRVEIPKAHGGHMHDWSTATRLVTNAPATKDGKVLRFDFVLPDHEEMVFVSPVEYSAVGYVPFWDEVSQLVLDADLANLQPSDRKSPARGARWLEHKDEKGFARVLWSEALQVALLVEAGRNDGTLLRSQKAELQPMVEVLPWTRLDGYALKDVNDFRD